ncbi:MAG: InlB B-repeat-containing protein, partial [Lactococcus raffinolactis]
IIYHLDGGDNDSANPAKYTYDVGVASFEDATKDGYHFLGWYDAVEGGNRITNISSTATGTKDLYAHWDYTITYELDGGTNGANPTHYEFGTGVSSFNPASKDGHDFQGWYDADTGGNKVTNIPATAKEDKTLYARFTPSEYTIAYELDGGTNSTANPDSYTYGVGVPSFEDATKDGYIFLGWFDAESGGNAITDISDTTMGNQTLYAHFKYDYARLEAKPIVRTVVKNTTYTWHHPEHEPVLYDEDNNIVPDADIWAIVDGVAYKATDAAELPEGVHDVTFTNVNPMTRFTPFNRLVTCATVREVTTHTTATIIAKDLEPAPITVRYVDQSGKELKTATVYTGKIGDAITSNAPTIAGYELISLSDKITATITDQAQTFTFVYKPVTQTPALPPTGQQLPKTGESQSAFSLILGFILVALVSVLTWFKLGKRNTRHSD